MKAKYIAYSNFCFTLFCGLVIIGTNKGNMIIISIWTCLIISVSMVLMHSLDREREREKEYRKYGAYYKAVEENEDDDNTIVPILGNIPVESFQNVAGMNTFDKSLHKSVNVISLPAFMNFTCIKKDELMIFAYMLIVEHEVIHGISSRETLNITEQHLNNLQTTLIKSPQHWSHEEFFVKTDYAGFRRRSRILNELNIGKWIRIK